MPEYYGGIDFSGAKEPLSNLWTAVGVEREGKLHVQALCPQPFRADLAHYVAGGWRRMVGAADDATVLWGADFPFGVPAAAAVQLVGEHAGWPELVAWIADRPADEVRDAAPDAQRATRRTDTGKALPPFDLRLYRQTVEGIRWIQQLRETLDEDELSIPPLHAHAGAPTTLIEVYPAATLVDLGLRCRRVPLRAGEVRARPAALRTFVTFADPSLEATAVALEDAWDATLACLTAFLVRDDLDQPRRVVDAAALAEVAREGWIYRVPAALG